MKHIAQFEARLTYGGLNNSARTPLEPIREACVQVATGIFAMRDGPNRQGALLAQLAVWQYAISCAQTQEAPATATAGAAG